MREIKMQPTWEDAMYVYIAVLRNPEAGFHAIRNAETELLNLARSVDALAKQNQKEL